MTESVAKNQGLLGVRRFVIQLDVLNQTIHFLQEVGLEGYKGFVSSGRNPSEIRRTCGSASALIPAQNAMATDGGLLVVVEGEALFHVNKTVHERGRAGGQVASAPDIGVSLFHR